MTLDELIQHARSNRLVTTANRLEPGQLAMIVQWGHGPSATGYRERSRGTLVLRQHGSDYPLLAVASPEEDDYSVGSYWSEISAIEVMPLTPEHPGALPAGATPTNATNLGFGQAGLVTSCASASAAVGCLVVRERGDSLIIVERSPNDPSWGRGVYWAPDAVPMVQVVPVDIEFPFEVEA